jgi:hypothetical protein
MHDLTRSAFDHRADRPFQQGRQRLDTPGARRFIARGARIGAQMTGRRAAMLICAMLAGALLAAPAQAQQHPPRRIAPDRFPDYGVHAPLAAPEAAAARVPPSAGRPLGACVRDMPAGGWLRCLRDTAALGDQELDTVATRIKAQFAAREDANEVLRRAWGKALDESQTRWRALRDYECQRLALAEPEAPKELLEARFICAIRRDLARAGVLAARYRLDD